MERRKFLGLGFSAVAITALQSASQANILKDHAAAFDAKSTKDAVSGLYGSASTTSDDKAKLKVPDIAENGAAVPITVSSSLDNVKTMAVTVDGNPHPLTVAWEVPEGTMPKFSTRIKMRKTAKVTLMVEDSNGKVHTASKTVKVTVGGCGG
jgi:sulfur-oxidizing protein SoxY